MKKDGKLMEHELKVDGACLLMGQPRVSLKGVPVGAYVAKPEAHATP